MKISSPVKAAIPAPVRAPAAIPPAAALPPKVLANAGPPYHPAAIGAATLRASPKNDISYSYLFKLYNTM
jgi:hypothetical protein